jgi:hypothetical protein
MREVDDLILITVDDHIIEPPDLFTHHLQPQSLDEVRPGRSDVHERVKDLDAGGVLASMSFPSFPTSTARGFASDLEDMGEWSPDYTALRAVNALPVVCATSPGIRTTVDLPQVIAMLGEGASQ